MTVVSVTVRLNNNVDDVVGSDGLAAADKLSFESAAASEERRMGDMGRNNPVPVALCGCS
jgi:hypothetical protein